MKIICLIGIAIICLIICLINLIGIAIVSYGYN